VNKSVFKKERFPIEKAVLGMLVIPGVIAVAAIAPGIGPALKMFGLGKKTYPRKYVTNTLSRMKQKGLIRFEEKNGKNCVVLTESGRKKLEQIRKSEYAIKKPERWDGKWRIVIFDIKEKKRDVRDQFRRELTQVGFVKLQHSVWIYPYDCEEFIKMAKADYRIGKDILYIVAERVEYDKNLKPLFNL